MRFFAKLLVPLLTAAVLVTVAACGEDSEAGVNNETLTPTPAATDQEPTNTVIDTPTVDPDLIDQECDCVANELLVKFTSLEPSDQVEEILARFDAHRIKENFDLGGAWVLEVPRESREDLLAALANHPEVDYAERNHVGRAGG